MKQQLQNSLELRSLDDGTEQDRATLPIFYKETFVEAGDSDAATFDYWINDLIDKHPTTSLKDFFYVVDRAENDKIVSAVLRIPQILAYEGIEVQTGRVELVATDKAYRRQGLVRALMDATHLRSKEQGDILTLITGIPYYYRRFGYAMCTDLGPRSILPFAAIREQKADYEPAYRLRPAIYDDIPAFLAIDAQRQKEVILSSIRTEKIWRYDIDGRSEEAPINFIVYSIVDSDNNVVGYVIVWKFSEQATRVYVPQYVVGAETSPLSTYNDVIYELKRIGQAQSDKIQSISFAAATYSAFDRMNQYTYMGSYNERTYANYLRVPDLAEFLKRIIPILENRLAKSDARYYTGKLGIGSYQFQLITLHFKNGNITDITEEAHDEVGNDGVDCRFPYLTFLEMVFGYSDVDEIKHMYPDFSVSAKSAVLLDILFPKKRSSLFLLY